jgi:predicted ester cyclase
MQTITEKNKHAVARFNHEFVIQGKMESFKELVADEVINHAAQAGSSSGPDGMIHFIQDIFKAGFPDLQVKILDQIAEGDKVTSRKEFYGTHTGELLGIPPSYKKVTIKVIDIIRLKDGKYIEHWGMSNFSDILAEISAK